MDQLISAIEENFVISVNIKNKAVWPFMYRCCYFRGKHKFKFLWDKCPWGKMAGLYGKHIISWKTANCKNAVYIHTDIIKDILYYMKFNFCILVLLVFFNFAVLIDINILSEYRSLFLIVNDVASLYVCYPFIHFLWNVYSCLFASFLVNYFSIMISAKSYIFGYRSVRIVFSSLSWS